VALRDPFRCFLVVGALVGVALAIGVPRFAGIDEAAHFERTYAISEFHLVPVEQSGFHGGVVCIPRSVVRDVRPDDKQVGVGRCGNGRVAADVATFSWYSPLAYVPQAIGVGAVRLVGGGVGAMDNAGRLLLMASYVALVALAIRRSPYGKWAFVAVGLLPASIYEAATSLSPGPLTVAFALLVVSSALRMCRPDDDRRLRVLIAEATVLTVGLALCKPAYLVVAVAYALPLITTPRRWNRWPVVLPVGVAAAVSYVWQHGTRHLFVCDVRYFGVSPNPRVATDHILQAPFKFLWESTRSVYDFAGNWTDDLVRIGHGANRELRWPTAVCAVVLIGFALLAIQRDRTETMTINISQRAALLGGFIAGALAVLAAWLVYCSEPEIDIVGAPHARLFLPVLVLAPLAVAPVRGRLVGLANARVPLSVGLVAFYAVWTPSVISYLR
jgi:uncharacterized membrane protein